MEQKLPQRKKEKTPTKKETEPIQKGREQKSVNDILLETNMNVYGFFPANMSYYDQQYVLNQLPPGYTLRKSRVNQYNKVVVGW